MQAFASQIVAREAGVAFQIHTKLRPGLVFRIRSSKEAARSQDVEWAATVAKPCQRLASSFRHKQQRERLVDSSQPLV